MAGRAPAGGQGLSYRRDIDGLRAIAVLAVMAFHAGFPQVAGGYAGVDVFLVISGYLITGILLEDIRQGRFSLVGFYDRRARRILPALFVVLAASTAAALALLTPREMVDYAKSLAAVAGFVANFFFARGGGYFDGAAELKPLLHTWSLAVEEQYYILFPLLLVALLRRGRPERRAMWWLAALGVASLALSAWGAQAAPRPSFFLLPTRAWELLLGACLAFRRTNDAPTTPGRPWLEEGLSASGLALIAGSFVAFDARTPFPGVHALVPTLGAVLLLRPASAATAAGRLLATPVLVGVGLVSYSAYLWHQPLLAFARIHAGAELPLWQAGGWCVLALVLGALSWRFVEQPFRRRGVWPQAVVLRRSAAGLAAVIAIGAAGIASHGFERLYVARLGEADLKLYGLIKAATSRTMFDDMVDDGKCRFWSPRVTDAAVQRFRACTAGGSKALVVLGDSHAMNIFNALARVQAAPVLVGFAQPGCQPYSPQKECHYADFERFLAGNRGGVGRIVYHQSGSYLLLDDQGRADSDRALEAPAAFTVDHAGIAQVDAFLNRLQEGGTRVTWLGPFPEPRRDMRNLRAVRSGRGFSPEVSVAFTALEADIRRVALAPTARYDYVAMLNASIGLDEPLLQGDCLLYRDKDHLSACAERMVGDRLAAIPVGWR